MSAAPHKSDKIVRLEAFRALREKIAAESAAKKPSAGTAIATGVPAIDDTVGGLHRSALTEFSGSSGHGALMLSAVLGIALRERWQIALVDAADHFDPASWPAQALRRMLWVRCHDARQAIRAADILLRDGNLPLLALDLQGIPAKRIRGIPANVWHRFQRIVEESAVAVVVLTNWPMVEGARIRIEATERLTLHAQRRRRNRLASGMNVTTRHKLLEIRTRSA